MIMSDRTRPYYVPVADEERIFKAAYRQGLSILLKGPTGCGKTRFVEAMAHDLGRPLITVAFFNRAQPHAPPSPALSSDDSTVVSGLLEMIGAYLSE